MDDTGTHGVIATAPPWFQDAIAEAPASHRVQAQGCDIHYLRWGPAQSELPGLLFLHAGGAHARWWSFIAPFFSAERPVAALDFSGMGDSGRRERYASSLHVAEIAAVLEDAKLGAQPIVVGHSFGGFMAMCHGHQHAGELGGIVCVDTPLRPADEAKTDPVQPYTRPTRYYDDQKSILSRFKLGPAQPCENAFILDYIARNSIVQHAEGWAWKFDVAARGASHHDEPLADYLVDLACRKALIYGECSAMVTPEVRPYLISLFSSDDPVVCLAGTHHHLFLEEPRAFVTAMSEILAGWRRGA
ncbi:MAG: alpha/beta hydrolase [Chromatiales bacterium]|jgi:pimeloyl-ACP methyl ester carboxylesterase|nr:alpha/beta hydrolase [Chromatiales bacterium]